MSPGRIGPLTEALESAATTVGAGMLVGGFVFGTVAFIGGRSRQELAERALTDGYVGGIVGVALSLADLVIRYAV